METKKYMGHIRKYSDDWYQQKEAEKVPHYLHIFTLY